LIVELLVRAWLADEAWGCFAMVDEASASAFVADAIESA